MYTRDSNTQELCINVRGLEHKVTYDTQDIHRSLTAPPTESFTNRNIVELKNVHHCFHSIREKVRLITV